MIHATLLALALSAPIAPPAAAPVCVLSASTSTISATTGGSQFLQLHTSAANVHPEFFGSMTATAIGTRFNGVVLPLAIDRYFFAAYHGGKFLQPYAGFDARGNMTAELRFPAGLQRLAGVTLYHAFTADDFNLLPVCASNAVAVTFVP